MQPPASPRDVFSPVKMNKTCVGWSYDEACEKIYTLTGEGYLKKRFRVAPTEVKN